MATKDKAKAKGTTTKGGSGKPPNILVIWGDDIGQSQPQLLHARADGLPDAQHRPHRQGRHDVHRHLRRAVAAPPAARRSSPGRACYRTGLSKVGIPGAPIGMNEKIVTIAALLKEQGYATGQFGKNHLGDLNHMLPTNHGFDEFFGNLYHLNAEEEPEMDDYPEGLPDFREKLRAARRDPLLGDRQGRPDRAAALGQGRQAEDRGHRAAHQEAHGDLRRRVRRGRQGLHQAPEQGRQAVLRLAQHHAHAPVHAHQEGEPGAGRAAGSRRTTTR